ncbi:MAG: hypothetical protein HYR72_09485 [Deltaproteobacteria bacterium]|nr:hypothetical protein [Deltaproteobacteria bacterium]MBI3387930.1 hypothetical protein [Deltaproteobacteria bacterium]
MALYLSRPDGLFTVGEILSGAGPVARDTRPLIRTLEGEAPIPFTPIGLNKPLTIEIRHVYTGAYPSSGLFASDKSMLVASSMKGFLQTGAAPRAVNFQSRKLSNHTHLSTVPAPDLGSPLVCYSPAVTEGSYSLTVEVGFNTFDQDVFDALGQIFTEAAGFPLFAPYSGYLVAAGTLTKITGKLVHAVFNAGIVLADTREINLFHPGVPPTPGGFALATLDTPEGRALRNDYTLSVTGQLVSKTSGQEYNGDVPYVVLSLDGTPRDEFKTFTPLAASADQLNRFFNIADNSSKPITEIVEGLRLFNDLAYRRKADDLNAKLASIADKNSKDYTSTKEAYDAAIANIQSQEMKPKP